MDQEIQLSENEIDSMIESSGEDAFPYFFFLQGRKHAFQDIKEKLKENFIWTDQHTQEN